MAPNQRQHRCEDCNLDFYSAFSLKRHYKKKHVSADKNEAEEPQCNICSKKFSNTHNLKRHVIQIHETDRNQPTRAKKKKKYQKTNLTVGKKQSSLARKKLRSIIAGRSVESSSAENCVAEALLLMAQTAPADKEILEYENHPCARDEELKQANIPDVEDSGMHHYLEEVADAIQEQAEIREVEVPSPKLQKTPRTPIPHVALAVDGESACDSRRLSAIRSQTHGASLPTGYSSLPATPLMTTSTPCSGNPVEHEHRGKSSRHLNFDGNLQPLSTLNETNCSCDRSITLDQTFLCSKCATVIPACAINHDVLCGICEKCGRQGLVAPIADNEMDDSTPYEHELPDGNQMSEQSGTSEEMPHLPSSAQNFGFVSSSRDLPMENYDKVCEKEGLPDVVRALWRAVSENRLNHLTLKIIYETCLAVLLDNIAGLRYSNESKLFWKTFQTNFGDGPIRYLSGWKLAGCDLSGETEHGNYPGTLNDVIIAIPNIRILRDFKPYDDKWPSALQPGIFSSVLSSLSRTCNDTSVCLAMDSKTLAEGIRDGEGQINLGGFEKESESPAALLSKMDALRSSFIALESRCSPGENAVPTRAYTEEVRKVIHLLSEHMLHVDLIHKACGFKLENSKKKAEAEIGFTTYRKSRYALAISSASAQIHTSSSILKKGLEVIRKLNKLVVEQHFFFSDADIVDSKQIPTYFSLTESETENVASHLVKQRSDAWFQLREIHKITGSRLNAFLGLDTLKAMNMAWQYFFGSIAEFPSPPASATEALQHGIRCEPHAAATIAERILPVWYPGSSFFEIGVFICGIVENLSVLSSPDGIVRDSTGKGVCTVEIKCPSSANYSSLPERYYIQVMAGIAAAIDCDEHVDHCLFVLYYEETTRAFRVDFDPEVWSFVCSILDQVHSCEEIPLKRFLPESKELKQLIKKNLPGHVTFLGLVPSLQNVTVGTPSSQSSSRFPGYADYGAGLPNGNPFVDPDSVTETTEICQQSSSFISELHHILMKPAAEVMSFVATSMDKTFSKQGYTSVPVAYFLKGRSIPLKTVRDIMEHVLNEMHRENIHVPAVSFDGQFHGLLQRDEDLNPMTRYALIKDTWKSVVKMPAATLKQQFVDAIRDVHRSKRISGEELEYPTFVHRALLKAKNKEQGNANKSKGTARGRKETSAEESDIKLVKKLVKSELAVFYAEHIYPHELSQWRNRAKVDCPLEIDDLGVIDWFYIPEYSSMRNSLIVKKIDTMHLLCRLRAALCSGSIAGATKDHWIEVAKSGTVKNLKQGLVADVPENIQNTDYAQIIFSEEVETQLKSLGHSGSAEFCRLVRNWFHANDYAGISAIERCKMKLEFRSYLLSFYGCHSFPPPMSHISNIPRDTWEALIAGIDADLFLYAISRRRTYNVRSVSSQPVETLYSCLSKISGTTDGVPSASGVSRNMAKAVGTYLVRTDPDKRWSTQWTKAPFIPESILVAEVGALPSPQPPPIKITNIEIRDHMFDASERARRKRPAPQGISDMQSFAKGCSGVRKYHKVNEALVPHLRANLADCDL